MWIIDKEFNFEMGHRVWAQKLDHPDLSIETACACKHLHGHSYSAKVFLSSYKLDQSSMVTDFKNLNFIKKFLDENLDHKFMIDINDPNFQMITGIARSMLSMCRFRGQYINLGALEPSKDSEIQLHRDSFVLVNFVPTSENICKFIFNYAKEHLNDLVKVDAVELWETKKSHCRYSEG